MYSNRLWIVFIGMMAFFSACQSSDQKTNNTTQSAGQSDFRKVVVAEVLQATEYTYLHGKENNNDVWLAVPSMQAKAGDTYYFKGGLQMTKFESKELKRTFESILLLEKINTEPKESAIAATNNVTTSAPVADNSYSATPGNTTGTPATSEQYTRTAPVIEKKAIKVEPAKGGITIAQLFSKKSSYAGKTVKIKGQVTKFTPMVMGKNWIHIQDGTDNNGKFDLTVTSDAEAKVGDMVTLEGKIALDKDLGYGYFFDVLMEEAAKQ